jgi:hypothetical protein
MNRARAGGRGFESSTSKSMIMSTSEGVNLGDLYVSEDDFQLH